MSKRYRVLFSRNAQSDWAAILDSLVVDSPRAAEHLSRRMLFRLQMLRGNPELGERCDALGRELRRTTVGKYVVYYQFSTHVEIVHILHGYRDHGPLLADLD